MPSRPVPTLDEQLLRASEAMIRYAFASGLTVPEPVTDVVHQAASAGGTPDVRQLTRAHNELVRIVAPATPRTILVVSEGRQSALSMLGPV